MFLLLKFLSFLKLLSHITFVDVGGIIEKNVIIIVFLSVPLGIDGLITQKLRQGTKLVAMRPGIAKNVG